MRPHPHRRNHQLQWWQQDHHHAPLSPRLKLSRTPNPPHSTIPFIHLEFVLRHGRGQWLASTHHPPCQLPRLRLPPLPPEICPPHHPNHSSPATLTIHPHAHYPTHPICQPSLPAHHRLNAIPTASRSNPPHPPHWSNPPPQ